MEKNCEIFLTVWQIKVLKIQAKVFTVKNDIYIRVFKF